MTPADPAAARLISVNLGIARPLLASGRRVLSAIGKEGTADLSVAAYVDDAYQVDRACQPPRVWPGKQGCLRSRNP